MWSDWQDPIVSTYPTDGLYLNWQPEGQGGNTATANNAQSVDMNALKDNQTGVLYRRGWQHSLRAGWDSYRDWFPLPLRSLVEGVDYTAIPGKDPARDDDAYVEYESADPNTRGAWVLGDWAVSNVNAFPGEVATWHVGWATGSTYAPGPLDPWPGLGSTFATFTKADEGLGLGHPSGVPDSAESVLHLIDVDYAGTDVVDATVSALAPRITITLPRWRYWVPGEAPRLPLRQRQRDDGLGLSTARWRRGSSRQGSNRWRGYL